LTIINFVILWWEKKRKSINFCTFALFYS